MHTDAGSGRCDDGPAGSAAEDGDLRSEGRGITSIAGSGLAGTRLGRLSISVVVVCVFASIVVANLPDSPTQDRLSPIAEPLVDGLGVRQGWAVFSPNPTSISVLLEARLTYDDGTTSTWRVPRGGPVLDSVRSERWRQIDVKLRQDAYSGRWRSFAEWLAEEASDPDRRVTEVELDRIFASNPPPGETDGRSWERVRFYRLDLVTGNERRRASDAVRAEAP